MPACARIASRPLVVLCALAGLAGPAAAQPRPPRTPDPRPGQPADDPLERERQLAAPGEEVIAPVRDLGEPPAGGRVDDGADVTGAERAGAHDSVRRAKGRCALRAARARPPLCSVTAAA